MDYTFIKHATKVTKAVGSARPILNGVHHAENGSLYVTDSHRLMYQHYVHDLKDGRVINPKDGTSIDGNYPDVGRLIPNEDDAKDTFIINLDKVIKFLKAAKTIEGKGFKVELVQGDLSLYTEEKYYTLEYKVLSNKETTFLLEGQYLLDMCEWLITHYPTAKVSFYAQHKPVQFSVSDKIGGIVLPRRKY